jgi:hypothetical protein
MKRLSYVYFYAPAIDLYGNIMRGVDQEPVMEVRTGFLRYWGTDIGETETGVLGQRTYCFVEDEDSGHVLKILPESISFKPYDKKENIKQD